MDLGESQEWLDKWKEKYADPTEPTKRDMQMLREEYAIKCKMYFIQGLLVGSGLITIITLLIHML